MNYTTTRKLIVSNILVSGLLIFSGVIFGMKKELKISDSLVVSSNDVYARNSNGWSPIQSDGKINENIIINRSSGGNVLIQEKDCEDRQKSVNNIYSARIVGPRIMPKNGDVDQKCYFKVDQQYISSVDEHGNLIPNSGSFRSINGFLVQTEFTKEQLKTLTTTRTHGQDDGAICAFDNCHNRYSICGAFCNSVDECDLYIYSSLNNTWTIVQSDNNAAQIVVDMPDDQEAAINSSYRACMIQKTKYEISIKPELEALPSIGTNITEKQLKKVKQFLLDQQNSDETSSKKVYVRDKFGNLYDIVSVSLKDKETDYTVLQFICIGIPFAVIIAAFLFYVNGLGVK